MEIVNAPLILNGYIREHQLNSFFSSDPPPMYLLRYAPGEMIATPVSRLQYVQFVVDGEFQLYDMASEASVAMLLTPYYKVRLLGDTELLDEKCVSMFVEAVTEVYAVGIPIEANREQLLNDNAFLRMVCHTLSAKLTSAALSQKLSLTESVRYYLRHITQENVVRDVGRLAAQFNTSSRQLLRVLKALCDEGVLEHIGKGEYRITRE